MDNQAFISLLKEIQSNIDRQRESLMMLKKYQVEFDNLDERIIGYIEASNSLERSIVSLMGKK
jgi:predicted  nucleic acid-binding Zn-ribbon protein